MLLATLFPEYVEGEFDIETAEDAPKRLVINFEQALEWAREELREGRSAENKWTCEEFETYRHKGATWFLDCNEEGSSETWILCVEDVPFWKPPGV